MKFDKKSALVNTWTPESSEAIKYLFPTAPKIAPKAKASFASISPNLGRKNIKQEIKKDNIPPKNNFKNNQDPTLEMFSDISSVSVTIGLKFAGEVWIISIYLNYIVIIEIELINIPSARLSISLENLLSKILLGLNLIIEVSTLVVNLNFNFWSSNG